MVHGAGLTSTYLYTDAHDAEAPKRCNKQYTKHLSNIFKHPVFLLLAALVAGLIGSHSLRKAAKTWAKRAGGCHSEETDVRGRWRHKRNQTSDVYESLEQPYYDAKVAAVLCIGGPIKYQLVPGSGITDQWLMEHVVPSIHQYFGEHSKVPRVLGLALLWAIMDGSLDDRLPSYIRDQPRAAYAALRRLPEGVNPVRKV